MPQRQTDAHSYSNRHVAYAYPSLLRTHIVVSNAPLNATAQSAGNICLLPLIRSFS
jgi:hypothetical protein